MQPSDKKAQVTVEDLLRLKAAERPGTEFWSQFERELRQKQLTALVQKRRWWHELPVLLSRRVYVPAGAAAIVAFTLVTVRYSSPLAQIENTAPKNLATADSAIESLPATEVSLTGDTYARSEVSADAARVVHREPTPVAVSGGDVTEAVGILPVPVAARESESPSARSIAANLARLEQSEPDLVNAVMGSRLSPARVMAAAAELETGDTMDASSAKKYRLIARYAEHSLSPEPVAPALVRDRIARRLGDDITEQISRVGIEGSRVSLKF